MRPHSIETATDSELVRMVRDKKYSPHYKKNCRAEMADRVRRYCATRFPDAPMQVT